MIWVVLMKSNHKTLACQKSPVHELGHLRSSTIFRGSLHHVLQLVHLHLHTLQEPGGRGGKGGEEREGREGEREGERGRGSPIQLFPAREDRHTAIQQTMHAGHGGQHNGCFKDNTGRTCLWSLTCDALI